MINSNLKLGLIIMTILYIFMMCRMIKKEKVQISYVTFWLVTALVGFLVTLFPEPILSFSKKLGFELVSNMIFVITIYILYFLTFKLLVMISKEKEKSAMLAQEISILKTRVNKLEKLEERNKQEVGNKTEDKKKK